MANKGALLESWFETDFPSPTESKQGNGQYDAPLYFHQGSPCENSGRLLFLPRQRADLFYPLLKIPGLFSVGIFGKTDRFSKVNTSSFSRGST